LFDGERLIQARQLAGLLKGDLAKQVQLTPAAISQFESGTTRPTTATLGRLALTLGVPVGYFAANRPRFDVKEEDTHFRSLRSTSKRDRAQARAQVALLAEIVAALERQVRLPPVDLPSIESETTPEDAARQTREAWGLGDGPIGNMVGLLERKGVIVSRLPTATDELDAFSWLGARPFVVLASNKEAADRARFDAAHELAHLLLHHDAHPGDPKLESIAHRFAAEFLAPAASIREELPSRVEWPVLAKLKLKWGVSIAMLVRRMRDLATISDASYRRAMMELGRRGWRTTEPIALGEPEQPELVGRAMQLLQRLRAYTISDLASDLKVPAEKLMPFALAWAADTREELAP
jgi:Zn-dependent peptidase ImmA (M78 family)/DNA-binding XRE family transcriptional regulator